MVPPLKTTTPEAHAESIRCFSTPDQRSVSIDLAQVIAVEQARAPSGATISRLVMRTNGGTHEYTVMESPSTVEEKWREAMAACTPNDPVLSLLDEVRHLAQSSMAKEDAILAMHGDVKNLTTQVRRLCDAVTSLEQTRR
tara:strand:+ start:3100 stop:3519 length:420 start_codon:yes stop_codon:yes gene_type:complete